MSLERKIHRFLFFSKPTFPNFPEPTTPKKIVKLCIKCLLEENMDSCFSKAPFFPAFWLWASVLNINPLSKVYGNRSFCVWAWCAVIISPPTAEIHLWFVSTKWYAGKTHYILFIFLLWHNFYCNSYSKGWTRKRKHFFSPCGLNLPVTEISKYTTWATCCKLQQSLFCKSGYGICSLQLYRFF